MVALLCIEEELESLYREHRASGYAFSLVPISRADLPSHRADAIATAILIADRRQRIGYLHENFWLSPGQIKDRHHREVPMPGDASVFDEEVFYYPRPPYRSREFKRSDRAKPISTKGICMDEDCDRPRSHQGLCGMHYKRMTRARARGQPLTSPHPEPDHQPLPEQPRSKTLIPLDYLSWGLWPFHVVPASVRSLCLTVERTGIP